MSTKNTNSTNNHLQQNAKFGGFFLLTYIGVAWYFLDVSSGFWGTILAFVKALFWPTFLIHRVFELLRI